MNHTLPPVNSGKHANNIDAKAKRCMPLVAEWAANLVAQNDRLTQAQALRAIERAMTGGEGEAAAELYWGALGKLHDERHPDAPGRKPTVFDTSRPVVLAYLDRAAWLLEHPPRFDPDDPFAGLDPF